MHTALRLVPLAALVAVAGSLAGCRGETAAAPPALDGAFARVDDGADVPGFAAFRDSLRATVARQDTAALLAVVADGARLSYGDDAGGADGMRAMWFSGTPPGSAPVWAVLGRLLDAGSVDEDGAVTVPYVFGAWPDSIDAATHLAVVGEGEASVQARTAPADTAAVAATLRDLILPAERSEAADAAGFAGVRLPDGTVAYVPADRAMSPLGWRATFFPDAGGVWKLQLLVSGD